MKHFNAQRIQRRKTKLHIHIYIILVMCISRTPFFQKPDVVKFNMLVTLSQHEKYIIKIRDKHIDVSNDVV